MRILTKTLLKPLTGLLILSSFCLTPLCAEDKVPAEQVLSPDTMLMVSVPSISELKSRFDETIWSDIFSNPEMAGMWEAVSKPIKEGLDEMKKETGIDWHDLKEIPSGEVTLSVTRVSRGKIGVALSVEYGDNEETLNKLLTKVEENLEDGESEKQVSEIEGTEVVQYAAAQDALPASQQVCWFQKDGFLVLSNELPALEAMLLRWDGENTDVLAEKEEFKYIRERCSSEGTQPAAYWYVDPLLLLKSAMEAGQSATQQAMVQVLLPRLGLDELKAVGGSIDLATERYEEVTQTVIYAEGPQVGLLKMFQANEVPISPPDWVSAEAESFIIYHWGLEAAVAEVRTMVDSFRGAGTFDVVLDQIAEHPGAQGLHPKKDFIDLLTGTMVVEITPSSSSDEATPTSLFAMGLKDGQKMSDVLAKVQKTEGSGFESRTFQGSIIYSIPLAESNALNVLVSQDYLFLSNSAERIEQVIRGGDSYQRLKDSKVFQQLAAEAPESAGLWGMEQTGSQLERASKQISELLNTLPSPGGADNPARDLLENFPKPDVLKKYATNSFFYVTTDERGVYWKSYSLRVNK
jgi:hypothetical protein